MRRNFLVLALAMAISHVACGADNNTTGHTSPEPPPEVSSKQADSMKTRLASQSSDQVDKLGPGSNALPPVPTLEDLRMVAPASARYPVAGPGRTRTPSPTSYLSPLLLG